ncbi:hypothetical protein [Confluentibacter flavum]|uniref:Uncharacterized protein n=1 Tax=Confluentibacter flavum TaxID=1909700 RepID=A0A2N3HLH8_9FLAO|nr:hypothetical protein [Confluentibacter flavum]PKQ45752.1 hypothetical protein CSW08_06710 [Confluentibacter flavum]
MVTLVNFADKKFRRNQKWNSATARLFGKVDKVIEYSPDDIEKSQWDLHKSSQKYSKGFGNYFWKPYLVNKALREVKDGDYLFSADSGSIFIKSIIPLIKHLEKNKKNILCFRLLLIEKQWTKRDAFILMDCDSPKYTDTPQITSTFVLVKKCKESIEFLNDWEQYSKDIRILTDDKSVLGPDYPEFLEHRHDQSILSLLCKKNNNVLIEGDMSDYGCFPYKYLFDSRHIFDKDMLNNSSNYIFKGTALSNRRVHPLIYFLKHSVRSILYKIGIRI